MFTTGYYTNANQQFNIVTTDTSFVYRLIAMVPLCGQNKNATNLNLKSFFKVMH